tara:strand:- start:53 stop:313 length:261 start_codon:yes stop_codon:yes gene_type:complete
MDSKTKKYLDKVVEHMVRRTRIDYDTLYFDFIITSPSTSFFLLHTLPTFPSFSKYCKNTFGLTEDEIEYVFKQYKSIILNKIENEQ